MTRKLTPRPIARPTPAEYGAALKTVCAMWAADALTDLADEAEPGADPLNAEELAGWLCDRNERDIEAWDVTDGGTYAAMCAHLGLEPAPFVPKALLLK